MSKENNLHDFLVDVADAIREKKGSIDKINPQNFSEEIRNLQSGGGSGEGSPFSVDFGEEIATGNPAYIGALQEDIDYYNEVQRRRAAGEVTDAALAQEQEFRDKIVWWPKGMTAGWYSNYQRIPYKKLRSYIMPEKGANYYAFQKSPALEEVEFTFNGSNASDCFLGDSNLRKVTIHGGGIITNASQMFRDCLCLEEVNMEHSNITNANFMFSGNHCLKDVVLDLANCTNAGSLFQACRADNLTVNLPKVTSLSSSFRELEVRDTFILDIPNVKSSSFSLFYNNGNYFKVNKVYISGLMVSMSLNYEGAKNVTMDSIKYILDHCQAREDGASYNLTLHANTKAAFMDKCDETSDSYDAEYAASLASANEKGLTIA